MTFKTRKLKFVMKNRFAAPVSIYFLMFLLKCLHFYKNLVVDAKKLIPKRFFIKTSWKQWNFSFAAQNRVFFGKGHSKQDNLRMSWKTALQRLFLFKTWPFYWNTFISTTLLQRRQKQLNLKGCLSKPNKNNTIVVLQPK